MLLRSRGNKSGQRITQQESPGGSRPQAQQPDAGDGALQVGAGSEEEPDFDGDEDMHEPKHEEQNIQINSPMHASKESRVNLSQKNSSMMGPPDFKTKNAQEDDEIGGGDGENVDDTY